MTVVFGYLRRDFLVWSSYRLAAFWQLASVIVLAAIVFLGGNAVGDRSKLIGEEGGSYVAFLLVGLAVMDLMAQAMNGLPAHISDSQRAGTLEPVLLAPISTTTLLLSFWLFRFLLAILRAVILIGFGVVALGFWRGADPLTILLVALPAIGTFAGIGALSGAFVIVVKQGDPIRLAYAGAMALLGGVVFPVSVLPSWLHPFAMLLPITYVLDGVRAGLDGRPPTAVAPQVLVLALTALILVPVGTLTFDRAVAHAKRRGSLGEY